MLKFTHTKVKIVFDFNLTVLDFQVYIYGFHEKIESVTP